MLKHTAWILAAALAMALPAGAQTRPGAPAAPSLIDLNSASQDDLMTLDGIGEVRAAAIIRARPFRTKGELVERRLIPEALYEKLADKVTVRPIPGTPPVPPTRPPTVPQRKS
jgi:DNA uptake protein ComE-like DNA-binding protein